MGFGAIRFVDGERGPVDRRARHVSAGVRGALPWKVHPSPTMGMQENSTIVSKGLPSRVLRHGHTLESRGIFLPSLVGRPSGGSYWNLPNP